MPLNFGEPAPWFTAPTASSPEFVFDTAAGRYVLMLFLPNEAEARFAALKALSANQALFDEAKVACFVVMADPPAEAGLRDMRGLRWIHDADGRVARLFAADRPHWLLLDPALRVMGSAPVEQADGVMRNLGRLAPVAGHAATRLHAPVLVAPRVFEPEFCEALIALHEAEGGRFTGVMRDKGDRTVAVMDALKKRRDVVVRDPDLQGAIRERLERRLFPLIKLGLGFTVTRVERDLVSCYDAEDGGVFHPHRDNTTQGTAHRRFACSINLNDDFEGGDLRFGEFGPTTYRPPPGGAVVFSCSLMHEATRITRGRRYAFLPFFFDEAGAETLAAYRARTAEPAEPTP